jgi:hypothetical protein
MKQLKDLETTNIYTVAKQKGVLLHMTFNTGEECFSYMDQQNLNITADQLAMAAEDLKVWEVSDNSPLHP